MGKIFLIFLLAKFSYAQVTLSEREVEKLISENPDVYAMQKRLHSAEELKDSLVRSFLPKISLFYGREHFRTEEFKGVEQSFAGVEAHLNVYNFGKDKIEDKIRNNNFEIAKIEHTLIRAQALAEIKKAMAHFSFLSEIKKVSINAMKQNENNLKSAQKRINAGLATGTDLLDFKHQENQYKQELTHLDYEIGVTRRLINTLLGFDVEKDVNIVFENSHPEHTDESKLSLDGKSLTLKKSEFLSEISRLEFDKESRWWAPHIDFYASAQQLTQRESDFADADDRREVIFSVKLNFPIFDGGEGNKKSQAAKAMLQASESEIRSVDLKFKRQKIDALKKLEIAHDLIHDAEESIKIMNDYSKAVLLEYSRGVKNSPDVLQASQRLIEANIRSAEVKKNYQFAKIEAEFFVGQFEGY